jgi:hypothetical protein
MGIDPAYGSSAFGIVVTQWVDGIVQILYADLVSQNGSYRRKES